MAAHAPATAIDKEFAGWADEGQWPEKIARGEIWPYTFKPPGKRRPGPRSQPAGRHPAVAHGSWSLPSPPRSTEY